MIFQLSGFYFTSLGFSGADGLRQQVGAGRGSYEVARVPAAVEM